MTFRWVPTRRLPALLGLGLPVAAFDGGTGVGLLTTLVYDAVLVAGSFAEARRLGKEPPEVARVVGGRLSVGVVNEIAIVLRNPTARPLEVVVRDDLPDGWRAEPAELRATLPPHSRRTLSYRVVPKKRGRASFGDLHVRIEGGARLGAAIATVGAEEEVRVYPNVTGPRRYDLAARLGDLRKVGFRQIRRAGGGGEFEQLREYVEGDSFRDLDWKSTAKRHRPVTRVFREERSQQVVLAIDAGRMMAARLTGGADPRAEADEVDGAEHSEGGHHDVAISKLDHAINAALMMAYVALRKGDRVGLVVFSDVVRAFVPPGRGPGHYRRLLEVLYDIEAEATHVDFRRLVEFVRLEVPKRALLMLFTDLVDDSQARPLVDYVRVLRRKHLPVCVTLEDRITTQMAEQPGDHEAAVYRRAAAADVLAERRSTEAHLRASGVDLVEASPGELAVAAVNKYLEIKARNRL